MNTKSTVMLASMILLVCLPNAIHPPSKSGASESYPVHNLSTGLNYTTIQEAIDANETLSGHTIFVEKGEYHENVVVKKSLSFVGEDTDTTIINGDGFGDVVRITADNVTVENLTVRKSGEWYPESGIVLTNVKNCCVKENKMENNANGIISFNSANISLINNKIENNSNGFMLNNLSDSVICGNNFSANSGYGIYLYRGSNNSMMKNEIESGQEAVEVESSSGDTIENNDIERYALGITILNCSDCAISANNVCECTGSSIQLASGSTRNTVCENNITENSSSGIIILNSPNNTLYGNSVSNCDFSGIDLDSSTGNVIYENDVLMNNYGIYIYVSHENFIFHNNFVNNSMNVFSFYSINYWNCSTSEGNYWSDYNGTDNNQDGIGDTPLIIEGATPYGSENDKDHYTLMGAFQSFNVSAWNISADLFEEVTVISNSTIEKAELFLDQGTSQYPWHLNFAVHGQNGTIGFCRITFPNDMLNSSTYPIDIREGYILKIPTQIRIVGSNGTHTTIYFTYNQTLSDYNIEIFPEFPSFLALPLFMIATLLATILYKRRHLTRAL